MDDKGTLCFATDCTLTDPEMNDTHDGNSAGNPLAVDFQPSLPREDEEEAIRDVEAVHDAAGAPAGDAHTAVEPVGASAAGVSPAQIVEALLFSSDGPLSAARLSELADTLTPSVVRKQIEALNEKYEQVGLSFRIELIARGYQMMTLPDYRPWLERLNKQRSETRLSAAALETLSIIAYKQPVIRVDVEAIRGVACGEVIARLREMGLVRVIGRAEVVGRPLLYGTTKRFLDVFGLADLDDLPPMDVLRLKSARKPVEDVEPVQLPPVRETSLAQVAAAGA
jgi:segregation and condensation protein B